MFFKRKEWRPAPWWERMQAAKRRYARRLADRLNRKISGVPRGLMRQYILFFLIVLTAFNGLVLMRAIGQYWGGKVSPVASGRQEWKLAPPFRAWRFDEKLYDSLKKQRPGLADSLKMLEGIY